jgi:hypothetical protein
VPQPQQDQAQAHQQHRHTGTATRRPDAAPALFTAGSPSGGAHAQGEASAIRPLPCLTLLGRVVPAIRRATTRPRGLAATECRTGPARPARGTLPPPAVVHPATRTAAAASKTPTRRDRARAGQAVIASSRHGSSANPLDAPPPGQVPPYVH